jgi:hypothetical protein
LALAVPLSRFTPRVGGGSAFYVRHHSRAMKLITKLTKDKKYHLVYRIEATDAELAAIDQAGIRSHEVCSGGGWIPSLTIQQLLDGQRFDSEIVNNIQIMEGQIQAAANSMKSLLATFGGLGETKRREI